MISFDITSLYTNTPIIVALEAVKKELTADPEVTHRTKPSIEKIILGIQLCCLTFTIFKFRGKESESRSSQTKPTGLPIIHGKKSTRSIPLVNTTNAPAQYMSGIVKSTTQTSNSSSAASHIPVNSLQNDIVTASTCTFNNDTKYSNMRGKHFICPSVYLSVCLPFYPSVFLFVS
ncbi:unnamed protein product [Trichobilharzia regenti]|nr:unnamed protein product [Trichobilharzia regenti]